MPCELIQLCWRLAACFAFWFGEPAPSHRYVAEYNAQVLVLPESETAWRIVREAALHPAPFIEGSKYPELSLDATVPEDPLWPSVVKSVEANRAGLERAFVVAERSRMGMPLIVFRDTATREENWAALDRVDPEASPSPIAVSLPHLGQVRAWSRQLAADLRVAAEAGESDRVTRDLIAMFKLAKKCAEPPLLISQLLELAVGSYAAREVGFVLASYPGLLREEQLNLISEEVRSALARMDRPKLDWEWAVLHHWIGTVYSDDGRGNGVVTYSGLRAAADEVPPTQGEKIAGLVVGAIIGTSFTELNGSRRELTGTIEAVRKAIESDVDTDPWKRNTWNVDKVLPPDGSTAKQIGDFPIAIMLLSIKKLVSDWNTRRVQIGAALLAIEVEKYRLAKGDYPRNLAAIGGLDDMPLDPFDGLPIRYAYRVNELPVIYSIGADGSDDAGVPAKDNFAAGTLAELQTWKTGDEGRQGRLKGDHIYWPPVTVQWIDEGEKPFTPRRPVVQAPVRTP